MNFSGIWVNMVLLHNRKYHHLQIDQHILQSLLNVFFIKPEMVGVDNTGRDQYVKYNTLPEAKEYNSFDVKNFCQGLVGCQILGKDMVKMTRE